MAFDLYLAGITKIEIDEFAHAQNSCRLFSQYDGKSNIKRWTNCEGTTKLFIDCGAYAAYTRDEEIDIDSYIDYINSIDEHITIFASLDKIPGVHGHQKTIEQVLEAPKISWENYLYMRDKVKSPDKMLPVFHRREDFKWLQLMLETKFDGKPIPYIALAPTTDSSTQEKDDWLEKCYKIIAQSSNPNVKTHILGVTKLDLLERYPATSADSTSWILTSAMGSILSKYGTISLSERSTNKKSSIFHTIKDVPELHNYVNNFGFELEELRNNYVARAKFNILYLNDWAKNYKYQPIKVTRHSLF